jgi:hypothetical protein
MAVRSLKAGCVVRFGVAQPVIRTCRGESSTALERFPFPQFRNDSYKGGRLATFTRPKRQEIKADCAHGPQNLDSPFAIWILATLASSPVAEGVVKDISHEGLRDLPREEGVRDHVVRARKGSNDPDFEAKRDRIVELYALADRPRSGRDLPRRVRPAQPLSAARRLLLGIPGQAAPDPPIGGRVFAVAAVSSRDSPATELHAARASALFWGPTALRVKR